MNDKLFEEMLLEIDTMTAEDYWKLYHDAQNLSDFPPRDPYYSVMPVAEFSITQFASMYSTVEDDICLMVA